MFVSFPVLHLFISSILELGLRIERGFLTESSGHKSEELLLIVSEFLQQLAVGIKMMCMSGLLSVIFSYIYWSGNLTCTKVYADSNIYQNILSGNSGFVENNLILHNK